MNRCCDGSMGLAAGERATFVSNNNMSGGVGHDDACYQTSVPESTLLADHMIICEDAVNKSAFGNQTCAGRCFE